MCIMLNAVLIKLLRSTTVHDYNICRVYDELLVTWQRNNGFCSSTLRSEERRAKGDWSSTETAKRSVCFL